MLSQSLPRLCLAAALVFAAAPARAALMPSGEAQSAAAQPQPPVRENQPALPAFLQPLSQDDMAAYAGHPVVAFEAQRFLPPDQIKFLDLSAPDRQKRGSDLRALLQEKYPAFNAYIDHEIAAGKMAPTIYEMILNRFSLEKGSAYVVGKYCLLDLFEEAYPTSALPVLTALHQCRPYPTITFQDFSFKPEAYLAAFKAARARGMSDKEI
jgi:hypothetical protein